MPRPFIARPVVEVEKLPLAGGNDHHFRAVSREDAAGAPVPAFLFRRTGSREFEHLREEAPPEHHRQAPGSRAFHRRARRDDCGGGLPGSGGRGDQLLDEAGGKEGLVERGHYGPEDVPLGSESPDSDLEGGEHAPLVGGVGNGADGESAEFRSDLAVGVAEHHDQRVEAGREQGLRGRPDQGPPGAVRMGQKGLDPAHPLRFAGGEQDAGGVSRGFPSGLGDCGGPRARVYCGVLPGSPSRGGQGNFAVG